ncbi:cobalamin biosynthesis protein CobG [Streptomyces calidiresistens]
MSTRPATVPNREESSGRRRDDACPGALRLHAADDGALARVRLPGGLLDASAARVLADLAEEFGDGRIDLTSRGNMQLRALPADCGTELAGRLRAAGLLPSDTHERARNIVATPLAGARSGVHAVAREVDRALCADPVAARLSGRFLFAVDDGRGDVAALDADVTLVAPAAPGADPDTAPGAGRPDGWCLALGTGARVTVRREDAARAAILAARLFLTTGDTVAETAAPDTAVGGRPDRIWRVTDLPADLLPDTGRLIGALAAGGISADPDPRPLPARGPRPVPGPTRDGDGTPAVHALAPLGTLTAGQLRGVADLADLTGREGTGAPRVTPWRGLVLPLAPAPGDPAPDTGAARAVRVLEATGLITRPDEPWHGVGACTGRPGCGRALADVRADAARVHTRRRDPAALPVHWSGCSRRCGRPRGGPWIDVLAEPDGYRVTLRDADGAPANLPGGSPGGRERTGEPPGAAPPTPPPLPVDGVATALAALARGASP